MYAYITGTVTKNAPSYLVIETGGIGYKIFADKFSLSAAEVGQTLKLFTYLKVAEDDMSLYGFCFEEQKEMFEKLISISGVGPKAAMGILSSMRVDQINSALLSGDERAFTDAPGIGKKTAQRIVLELREKVDLSAGNPDLAAGAEFIGRSDAAADACEALVGLGYSRQEALSAVGAVKNLGDTAEELILLALKRLGG